VHEARVEQLHDARRVLCTLRYSVEWNVQRTAVPRDVNRHVLRFHLHDAPIPSVGVVDLSARKQLCRLLATCPENGDVGLDLTEFAERAIDALRRGEHGVDVLPIHAGGEQREFKVLERGVAHSAWTGKS